MTDTKKCEFCDKRGLPLLLARNAVAPAGAGAPRAAELEVPLADEAAHYTTRLLRSGYVNLYDEARKRWETYFVTQDGYLFKLAQTPGATPVVPAKPFNCPDEAHRAIASCITIPDPKNATKVWIGFSDVLWTDAVRKANEAAAVRKQHMVEVDIKAILSGASPKGARPIAQVSAVVAEYALDNQKVQKALGWGPFQAISRSSAAERLIKEADALRPGVGKIITVPDPAGIAQELAALMKWNFDAFTSNPEYKRKLAASDAIDNIRIAVTQKAEADEIAAAEKLANDSMAANPLGHAFSEKTRENTEKLRNVEPAVLDRSIERTWQKYAKKFDEKGHEEWKKNFNKELAEYDKRNIAPLAVAHVAWMRSHALSDYFINNYDRQNVEAGKVYAEMLRRCTMATQDKLLCSKLYDEWLLGDVADSRNLLLQAMLLNQKSIVELVKKVLTVTIDPKQIPWDNVLTAYGELAEHARTVVGQLIVQFIGPITRMLDRIVDLPARAWSGAVVTGMVAGHPLVVCEVVGTKAQFRAYLARELIRASGQVLSEAQMKRAVNSELRRLQIRGARLDGNRQIRWIALADKRIFTQMPAGLTYSQKAQWLASSIRNVDAFKDGMMNRWRTLISTDFRAGVVTAALQLYCLTKVLEDEEKSLANEKYDASRRMYAAIMAIAGTTTEALGNALKGVAGLSLRYGQGLALTAGKVLTIFGRAAGILGGLVVAALDARKVNESIREGQYGLAWLFAGSAIAGLGLTIAIAAAAPLGALALPLIMVFLAILIVVGIVIEYVKDSPLQDWLERCPWGILQSQRYSDMKTEQEQLANALK